MSPRREGLETSHSTAFRNRINQPNASGRILHQSLSYLSIIRHHLPSLTIQSYPIPSYNPLQLLNPSLQHPIHPIQKRSISQHKSRIYIYIIYTPNLGLRITVFDREREQGRFRGSSEGAKGSSEGARGSTGKHYMAVQGRSKWEPEMASYVSA